MPRRAKPPSPDEIKAAADRAEGKRPKAAAGRPSGYQHEYAAQAEKLCALGATDMEIADFFESSVRTIYRWKLDYPEFCQALNAGKVQADERVSHSLYQRAVGYEHDSVKIFMPASATEPVYAPYREHVHPDTTAAIFWLKNRRPQDWRDRQEVEHSGTVKTALDPEALRNLTEDQLEQLRSIATALAPPDDGSSVE